MRTSGYLSKEYVESNIPELSNNNEVKYEYENAPEILYLEDDEKFHDDEGNMYEIETRGIKKYDKIYFKVGDIEKCFEMKRLRDTITDERKDGYIENKHYVYFIVNNPGLGARPDIKLFLTYTGLLRVLFVSQSTKVDKFVSWASETLFTVQMGSDEQKDELIGDIKKIPIKTIKAIFDKSAESLPCIYLFKLGAVSALRESMDIDINIPDNSTVCKFGFTDNIERRMLEHEADFLKINGVKLELMIYSIVDVLYLSDAEGSIKRYFRSMKFKYRKYKELVIINKTMQKDIDREYKEIVELYGGRTKELVHRIENMEHKNEIATMKNDKKSQDIINSLRLDLLKMEKSYEEKINEIKSELITVERKNVQDAQRSKEIYESNINELNQCLSKMEIKYRDEIYKSELNNKIMERDIYYLKLMNKSPGETIDIFDC